MNGKIFNSNNEESVIENEATDDCPNSWSDGRGEEVTGASDHGASRCVPHASSSSLPETSLTSLLMHGARFSHEASSFRSSFQQSHHHRSAVSQPAVSQMYVPGVADGVSTMSCSRQVGGQGIERTAPSFSSLALGAIFHHSEQSEDMEDDNYAALFRILDDAIDVLNESTDEKHGSCISFPGRVQTSKSKRDKMFEQ